MGKIKAEDLPLFVISDHLDSRDAVVAYIKEFLEESTDDEVDDMLKTVADSKYVKSTR